MPSRRRRCSPSLARARRCHSFSCLFVVSRARHVCLLILYFNVIIVRARAALLDVQQREDFIEHFLASEETNNGG